MSPLLPVAVRPPVLASTRFRQHAEYLAGRELADVFEYIFDTNLWGSAETQSGQGSELEATATVRAELPRLLQACEIHKLLDAPCGDFSWMSHIDLSSIDYIGIDVVESLVKLNIANYGGPHRHFLKRNIVTDPLPRADLVLCRDCLVHLSFDEIHLTLDNFQRSGAIYLLATTFVEVDRNTDITTGDWRPLNMCKPPFSLSEPLEIIFEECEEAGGAYSDKALGLWRLTSF